MGVGSGQIEVILKSFKKGEKVLNWREKIMGWWSAWGGRGKMWRRVGVRILE